MHYTRDLLPRLFTMLAESALSVKTVGRPLDDVARVWAETPQSGVRTVLVPWPTSFSCQALQMRHDDVTVALDAVLDSARNQEHRAPDHHGSPRRGRP